MVISMCHAFGGEDAARGPSVVCCMWILLTLRPFPVVGRRSLVVGRDGVLHPDDATVHLDAGVLIVVAIAVAFDLCLVYLCLALRNMRVVHFAGTKVEHVFCCCLSLPSSG